MVFGHAKTPKRENWMIDKTNRDKISIHGENWRGDEEGSRVIKESVAFVGVV